MKKLSLLGSTGSIGTQALQVVQNLREQGEKWEVAALAARSSVNRLEEQARKFHPEVVAAFDEGAALSLRQSLRDTDIQVLSGMEGLCEAAAWPGADLTLNAVVGMVGLQPTLAGLQAGKSWPWPTKRPWWRVAPSLWRLPGRGTCPSSRWTASTPPFSSACRDARSGAP